MPPFFFLLLTRTLTSQLGRAGQPAMAPAQPCPPLWEMSHSRLFVATGLRHAIVYFGVTHHPVHSPGTYEYKQQCVASVSVRLRQGQTRRRKSPVDPNLSLCMSCSCGLILLLFFSCCGDPCFGTALTARSTPPWCGAFRNKRPRDDDGDDGDGCGCWLVLAGTEEIGSGRPMPHSAPPFLPLGSYSSAEREKMPARRCKSKTTKRSSLRRSRLTLVHPCPTLIARI